MLFFSLYCIIGYLGFFRVKSDSLGEKKIRQYSLHKIKYLFKISCEKGKKKGVGPINGKPTPGGP